MVIDRVITVVDVDWIHHHFKLNNWCSDLTTSLPGTCHKLSPFRPETIKNLFYFKTQLVIYIFLCTFKYCTWDVGRHTFLLLLSAWLGLSSSSRQYSAYDFIIHFSHSQTVVS